MSQNPNTGTQTVTAVDIKRIPVRIDKQDTVISLGSCFSTEMGNRLETEGFEVLNNPFGVLYNPVSIANSIHLMTDGYSFGPKDVIPRDTNPVRKNKTVHASDGSAGFGQHRPIAPDGGGFVSFYHHGSMSRKTPEEFIKDANNALEMASEKFKEARWILITFGTAWVYRHIERNIIVSNCHKHPAWEFRRERLDIPDITGIWNGIVSSFCEKNFIFTVSPIRHRKDGMHGNQISKATLLLATEQIVQQHENAFYFPAYEIVLDELRDYSWYAEDLVHPSPAAVETVWQHFCSAAL